VVDDDGKGTFAACNAGPCRAASCDGDVAISCIGGVALRADCAARGQSCVADAGGSYCALAGACERDRCDGDTVVSCRAGRTLARVDCAATIPGGRCRDQRGAVDCVAAAWDPACPLDQRYVSWCDGAAGVACHTGVRLQVDCPAFRNGRCVADAGTAHPRCRIAGWP
jgi:hypothetical protein